MVSDCTYVLSASSPNYAISEPQFPLNMDSGILSNSKCATCLSLMSCKSFCSYNHSMNAFPKHILKQGPL